ncbi:MAG: hypothetical protein OJF47_001399 [Nitrospira sp.]|nr:MAG: hypothetical protein OJF47_001399 [Nitrospira sp.]
MRGEWFCRKYVEKSILERRQSVRLALNDGLSLLTVKRRDRSDIDQ